MAVFGKHLFHGSVTDSCTVTWSVSGRRRVSALVMWLGLWFFSPLPFHMPMAQLGSEMLSASDLLALLFRGVWSRVSFTMDQKSLRQ